MVEDVLTQPEAMIRLIYHLMNNFWHLDSLAFNEALQLAAVVARDIGSNVITRIGETLMVVTVFRHHHHLHLI